MAADTKQQLKKLKEESAMLFWSRRRKRGDPENLNNTKKNVFPIYFNVTHVRFFAEAPVLEHKFTFSSQTFKQSLLIIDEYQYLTAPKSGTFVVFDD